MFGKLSSWLVLPDLRPVYIEMGFVHNLMFLVSLDSRLIRFIVTVYTKILAVCLLINIDGFDQHYVLRKARMNS